jgi:hypothetical protein
MKLVKSTLLALAVMIAVLPVGAADVSRNDREALVPAQELAYLLAPIKTKEDLDRYLADLRQNPEAQSPLYALTPAARDRFLNSLVFTQGGIGGYYYADMQAQLSASQAYRLLSLFGAQHTTYLVNARVETRADQLIMENTVAPAEDVDSAVDYYNMECVSRATCGPKDGYICKSNC